MIAGVVLMVGGGRLVRPTLSHLHQTDPETLGDGNILAAQGRRKILAITRAALAEQERLRREAERLGGSV